MKFNERWLREWVDPGVGTAELAEQLTRAGLEVDAVEPAAPPDGFSGVVAAQVLESRPHPNADRLKLCVVDPGAGDPVEVVCGAPNARAGMRAALARPGARIAGGVKVRRAKIRGTASEGMLLSRAELGIGDEHDGIIELDPDAPPGADVFGLLGLDDSVFELSVTPDRGDCLCIAGIAREVGAINQLPARGPALDPVAPAIEDRLSVTLEAPEGCARYAGRVVRGIDPAATTPLWLSERLRRCGVRAVSPIVDVTNYVMLEFGQPLHAFDLHRLEGGIRVRRARAGERLTLLDEREVELRPSTLVIADDRRPVALAGIMGGLDTAVTDQTRDVFLESAWFGPSDLMGEPRFYKLGTDASHRFERGVDPALQQDAIERATRLLLDIAGGQAGPIVDERAPSHLPARSAVVRLRAGRIGRLLGMELPANEVADGLRRLGMEVVESDGGWSVTPPTHRFDIAIEEDLIEEVVRLAGYDRVPTVEIEGTVRPGGDPETGVPVARIRRVLIDRGYQEAVTYSFVDPALQSLLDPEVPPIRLANPISSELSVMRTHLWMGLAGALVRNVNRQERRVRLFETGLRFRRDPKLRARIGDVDGWGERGRDQVADVDQERCIAAAVMGATHPEQWGSDARGVDFFDLKSDVEALLDLTGQASRFSFVPFSHPALHPAEAAAIHGDGGEPVGLLGALHPRVRRELGLPAPVFVFEITLAALSSARVPGYAPVSRFPSVRRDIAVTVDEAVAADRILDAICQRSPATLNDSAIFDLYRGEGIDPGKKSVAIGLTFRSDSRTLDDTEVDGLIEDIVAGLEAEFGAELRR